MRRGEFTDEAPNTNVYPNRQAAAGVDSQQDAGRAVSGAFDPIRVIRRTRETEFEVILRPRRAWRASLPLPNRILSHFLDHFCVATGVELAVRRIAWPGSWSFDHVLCEDMGQIVGRGVAAILAARATTRGVPGRGHATCCMDDALVKICMSLENRARVDWNIEGGGDIDGFVDCWYDDNGKMAGWATGTNLRQFVDGFARGAGATLVITATQTGNLHHFYEAVFRALGDVSCQALGLTEARLAGDTGGLAGAVTYDVEREAEKLEPERADPDRPTEQQQRDLP